MSLTDSFDKRKDGKGSPKDREAAEFYEIASPFRNLCFIQPNGERLSLSYGRLRFAEYAPEKNCITLSYETHTVTLTGEGLDALYEAIDECRVRRLNCIDARYKALLKEKGVGFVSEMKIMQRE